MRKLTTIALLTSALFMPHYASADNDSTVADYLESETSSWSVGNTTGTAFDTYTEAANEVAGDQITTITVYDSRLFSSSSVGEIIGMKVDYLYGGSSQIGGELTNSTTITLDVNEYITSGSFTYSGSGDDDRVVAMTFNTSEGNTYTVGETSSVLSSSTTTNWSLSEDTSDNWALFGFYGTYDDYINSIGIVSGKGLNLEYQSIEFDDDVTIGSAEQGFLSTSIGANATSTEQSKSISTTYTETDSSSDSYTYTAGISTTMGVSVSYEVKYAGFATVSGKWEYSVTGSYSETVGKTEQASTSQSYTVSDTLDVPANSIYAMKTTVYSSTAAFPYTITYINTYDDATFEVEGELDNATSVNAFTEWLEIGYVDDDGSYVIYDEYQDDWGDSVPSSSISSLTSSSSSISSLTSSSSSDTSNTTTATMINSSDLNININAIDVNDANWVMSDEEIQYRQDNGITD